MRYYDIHVFYDVNTGFSVPYATEEDSTTDEVIRQAVMEDMLDAGDARCVDKVSEISEEEFRRMTQRGI